MTLTPEEVKQLFEPTKGEKRAMDRGKSKKQGETYNTMEKLFTAFGLVFKSSSCNRIAEYGTSRFINESRNLLLENKELSSYIQELIKVEARIEDLKKKRKEIEDEIDNLEYGVGWEEENEGEEPQHSVAESKLLKSVGLTPTNTFCDDSFLRFFLLSFMETKTPMPVRKYGALKNVDRVAYIEDLENRIKVLESK